MIDVQQFKTLIIRPTLQDIGMHSRNAEILLLGIALVESDLFYLSQVPHGPARGFYQMEGWVHDDQWTNYLNYRYEVAQKIRSLASTRYATEKIPASEMVGNVNYATAIARVKLLRIPEKLPDSNDVAAMASYWKRYWNTEGGAGRVEHFIDKFESSV